MNHQSSLFEYDDAASAVFSSCRTHRYALWRRWQEGGDYVQFIGLNPSTADEFTNDPTLRRCIDFAKTWGFAALCMTNLFSLRATKPQEMKKNARPNWEENDRWLREIAAAAKLTVAAWGDDGIFRNRDAEVKTMLAGASKLFCLGNTLKGNPRHPLYLKKVSVPCPL